MPYVGIDESQGDSGFSGFRGLVYPLASSCRTDFSYMARPLDHRCPQEQKHGLPYMKTLLALLLISTASAQEVTSGSMTIQAGAAFAPFTFSGNNFTTSGAFGFGFFLNPLNSPLSVGVYNFSMGDGTPESLAIGLTMNGVPFGIPSGPANGDAQVILTGSVNITGPGTYTAPFTLEATYIGAPVSSIHSVPGYSCPECQNIQFQGSGIAALTVINDPYVPGALLVTSENLTIKDVPEPNTFPLILLGFVGLGFYQLTRKMA
jgi:hypothetical protein